MIKTDQTDYAAAYRQYCTYGRGEAFECSQCHSRISLTPQSRPIVAEASARLEELKQKASRQLDEKPENP